MFQLSNCIFNQHCIFHQISYIIITHFCEIPNFKGHMLLLFPSYCETFHRWESWAFQQVLALDSCQQGRGYQAEKRSLGWADMVLPVRIRIFLTLQYNLAFFAVKILPFKGVPPPPFFFKVAFAWSNSPMQQTQKSIYPSIFSPPVTCS